MGSKWRIQVLYSLVRGPAATQASEVDVTFLFYQLSFLKFDVNIF